MPWARGQSGNPGGRPKAIVEVAELARLETAASIRALVRVRDAEDTPPAAVVAAATALLDRAWGRPTQMIATPPDSAPALLHHAAALLVSEEIIERMGRRTINGSIEPPPTECAEGNGKPVDMLGGPLPIE
jgi:hypothetical protein